MIKNCIVCNKEIKIIKERIGNNCGISKFILFSEEGILFLRKWFCNSCWKEIRSIK